MYRKAYNYSVVIFFLNLLFVSDVFAQVPSIFRSYVVRGSLETTFSAFNTIALICNSNLFKALFMPFFGFSLFFVFGSFLLRVFRNGSREGSSGLLYSFSMLVVGSVLVSSFILKKSDFLILDKKVNQNKVVAEMPDMICLVAGGMSFLKEGFINIIEATALYSEFSYDQNKNGDIYELALDAFQSPVKVSDSMNFEIKAFVEDCVSFAIEDRVISIEELYYTNNYIDVFKKAVDGNRGAIFFTKNYQGSPMTCAALLTKIETDCNKSFSSSSLGSSSWYSKTIKSSCTSFLRDAAPENSPAKSVFWQKCDSELGVFTSKVLKDSLSSAEFFKQKMISSILLNYMDESGYMSDSFKQRMNQGNKLIGLYSSTATWIPQLQILMFNAYIVVFPFLLLFLVTPLMKQILSFLLGTFVFFLAWDICDMSLYYQAVNAAQNVIAGIKDQTISLGTFLSFEDSVTQSFAIFGKYKLISMSTAGIFASILTKAGNSLAHMVGRQGLVFERGSGQAELLTKGAGASKKSDYLEENSGIGRTVLNDGISAVSNYSESESYKSENIKGSSFTNSSVSGKNTGLTSDTVSKGSISTSESSKINSAIMALMQSVSAYNASGFNGGKEGLDKIGETAEASVSSKEGLVSDVQSSSSDKDKKGSDFYTKLVTDHTGAAKICRDFINDDGGKLSFNNEILNKNLHDICKESAIVSTDVQSKSAMYSFNLGISGNKGLLGMSGEGTVSGGRIQTLNLVYQKLNRLAHKELGYANDYNLTKEQLARNLVQSYNNLLAEPTKEYNRKENQRENFNHAFFGVSEKKDNDIRFDILTMDVKEFEKKYNSTPQDFISIERHNNLAASRGVHIDNKFNNERLKSFAEKTGLMNEYNSRIVKGDWSFGSFKNSMGH